jgi:hypothetical protein
MTSGGAADEQSSRRYPSEVDKFGLDGDDGVLRQMLSQI